MTWLYILVQKIKDAIRGHSPKYTMMTQKEALEKLKRYWVNSHGDDYLVKILDLRNDVPQNHKSSKALDEEIDALTVVHSKFKKWTASAVAKAMLNKIEPNA